MPSSSMRSEDELAAERPDISPLLLGVRDDWLCAGKDESEPRRLVCREDRSLLYSSLPAVQLAPFEEGSRSAGRGRPSDPAARVDDESCCAPPAQLCSLSREETFWNCWLYCCCVFLNCCCWTSSPETLDDEYADAAAVP